MADAKTTGALSPEGVGLWDEETGTHLPQGLWESPAQKDQSEGVCSQSARQGRREPSGGQRPKHRAIVRRVGKSQQQVQGVWEAGNRKEKRMEERSCGVGQASILRTQGSIQPNVQYVWFCRPFVGFGNKYVTGTMAATIQISKCPRDTKRKVC